MTNEELVQYAEQPGTTTWALRNVSLEYYDKIAKYYGWNINPEDLRQKIVNEFVKQLSMRAFDHCQNRLDDCSVNVFRWSASSLRSDMWAEMTEGGKFDLAKAIQQCPMPLKFVDPVQLL